jgi:putative DNA primase/helicase
MSELSPDEPSIASAGADPGVRKAAAHEVRGAQTFAVTSASAAAPIADMVETSAFLDYATPGEPPGAPHEIVRTPEQRHARSQLYGEGGFASWNRILKSAKPENRLSILRNALAELHPLATCAGIDSTEISDWASNVREISDIVGTDQLQEFIAAAKSGQMNNRQPDEFLPKKPPRLSFLTLTEFLSLKIKQRGMLLEPILPEKGLAMLYASRGTGKTHVALGIAFAVATGTEFLRWKAPTPRRVLLIDGEMPASALQERLASIVAGAPNVQFDSDNIRILAGDLIEDGGIGNLAAPDVQRELDALLDGVALLVLDNLSSLTAVVRDNDAESWGPIQEWLLRLRRRNISVLIVHHAGKGGQQRGTSRREDVLDTSISLRRPADYAPTEGAKFEVHYEKIRGVYGEAAKPFEATLETRDGVAKWSTRELEDANRARIEALLDDGMSVREIADETGITKSTVHRIKKAIEAARRGADAD